MKKKITNVLNRFAFFLAIFQIKRKHKKIVWVPMRQFSFAIMQKSRRNDQSQDFQWQGLEEVWQINVATQTLFFSKFCSSMMHVSELKSLSDVLNLFWWLNKDFHWRNEFSTTANYWKLSWKKLKIMNARFASFVFFLPSALPTWQSLQASDEQSYKTVGTFFCFHVLLLHEIIIISRSSCHRPC